MLFIIKIELYNENEIIGMSARPLAHQRTNKTSSKIWTECKYLLKFSIIICCNSRRIRQYVDHGLLPVNDSLTVWLSNWMHNYGHSVLTKQPASIDPFPRKPISPRMTFPGSPHGSWRSFPFCALFNVSVVGSLTEVNHLLEHIHGLRPKLTEGFVMIDEFSYSAWIACSDDNNSTIDLGRPEVFAWNFGSLARRIFKFR